MDWQRQYESLARKLALASGMDPDFVVRDGCWSHFARFDRVAQHRRWAPIEYPAWLKFVPFASQISDD